MSASASAASPRASVARERPLSLCSLVSEANGEDPIGSAWSTARYVLVELPLPWGYDVFDGKDVPAGLRELVDDLAAAGNDWGLIAMAPDDVYSVPGLVRVIDLNLPEAPFREYARCEYLIPPEALASSLRMLAADAGCVKLDAWRQPPSGTRDLLVCTHGAVDACCAKFGYPVYRQLRQIAAASPASVRVWRCTHFGGHRFAATLLDMPEGRYWGRLQARHLAALVHRDGPVADLRGCYRGWAALPHPLQQVAEREAFVRGGWAWTECAVTPGEPPPLDAAGAHVSFAYAHAARGERGAITIDVLPHGTVMTRHATTDPELYEAPQYRTIVRHVTPQNGLLGSPLERQAAAREVLPVDDFPRG